MTNQARALVEVYLDLMAGIHPDHVDAVKQELASVLASERATCLKDFKDISLQEYSQYLMQKVAIRRPCKK